jgi:[acyl-carrier-protein] S-malonyltransferase
MNQTIACIFPGQGSQQVGMLSELCAEFPVVKKIFGQASDILHYDLLALVQNGSAETLNQTEYAQPALLVAGFAVWQVWCSQNAPMPAYFAGHSLGEYTALLCADVFNFSDAVSIVAERGRLMQQAVPVGQGAMAAIIGLTSEQVTEICCEAAEQAALTPANFNAIGQVVISGETEAVQRAILLAKKAGAKIAKLIPVSVPSHSPLMKSAAEKLGFFLQNMPFRHPQVPVVNNVDVLCATDPQAIKDALIRQLYSPVRWVETIQCLQQKGVNCVYELGPGKVLTALIKRIDPNLQTHAVSQGADFVAIHPITENPL